MARGMKEVKVMKVMNAMKAKKVIKAERTVQKRKSIAVGNLAKSLSVSKRKVEVGAHAAELENPTKKVKVKPQDEKTIAAERKTALTAMKLADLEELHKTNALGTETVKEILARTKEELIGKQISDLKELCGKKELKVGGAKGELVQRLLDHAKDEIKSNMVQALLIFEAKARKDAREQEAKAREEARIHAAKVREVVSTLKKEASAKTGQELKEALTSYGLKTGGTKNEKIERIVARQQEDGEVERVLAARARDLRKQELLCMDTTALMETCGRAKGVLDDHLVKQIIVDRIILSEGSSPGSTRQSATPK